MFVAKKQNPIVVLIGMVAVLAIAVVGMQNLLLKPEEVKLPFKGNVWNSKEELTVFERKSKSKTIETLYPNLKDIGSSLLLKERKEYLDFISLEVEWDILERVPYQYIGVMVPFSASTSGVEIGESMEGMREFTHNGQKLWVYFQKPTEVAEGPSYMDLIFLGPAKHKDQKGWVGVASELFEFPENGLYPKMMSDDVALNEVVDDREMQLETRKVSSLALKHYFGKVQRHEFEGMVPLENVGYTELMDQPNRYRGNIVNFTGSLIHLERKMLPSNEIQPGMEFFYQGYLLNSSKVPFLFRTLEKPSVEINKVLTVEGYFLQRYNFENRLRQAVWMPMMIATKMTPEKDGVILSNFERNGATTLVALILVLLVWIFFRANKIDRKLRVKTKKNFKKPKENQEQVS